MSVPNLVVRTPEEFAAAIPHMLGFEPQESLVAFSRTASGRAMLARIDLPRTPGERLDVTTTLVTAFDANVPRFRRAGQAPVDDARPGASRVAAHGDVTGRPSPAVSNDFVPPESVHIVCFSDDRRLADLASRELEFGLSLVDLPVHLRLFVTAERWVDLDTGNEGPCRRETSTRIAAERVAAGQRMPVSSREDLAASFRGDSRLVEEALPAARMADHFRSDVTERQWLTGQLDLHVARGLPLGDVDAARALLAVSRTTIRDAALFQVDPTNAVGHQAFWADLTRRAPDHVLAPAASLAAFASWQAGDGASAWCALERIPGEQRGYPLARLMTQILNEGINPDAWTSGPPTPGQSPGPAQAATWHHSRATRQAGNYPRAPGRDGHTPGRPHPGGPGSQAQPPPPPR